MGQNLVICSYVAAKEIGKYSVQWAICAHRNIRKPLLIERDSTTSWKKNKYIEKDFILYNNHINYIGTDILESILAVSIKKKNTL